MHRQQMHRQRGIGKWWQAIVQDRKINIGETYATSLNGGA